MTVPTFERWLKEVEEARDNPELQAAMAAERLLTSGHATAYSHAIELMDAAAVLRSFDVERLTRVANVGTDISTSFAFLVSLPFVEQFRSGSSTFNVHQTCRLGWRRRLAVRDPVRFRELSSAASSAYENDTSAAGLQERLYHLVTAAPDVAAPELDSIVARMGSIPDAQFSALTATLTELRRPQDAMDRAGVWIEVMIAWTEFNREEYEHLPAKMIWLADIAQKFKEDGALLNALFIRGRALSELGTDAAAEEPFLEAIEVGERLAAVDRDGGGQRRFALSHGNIGDWMVRSGRYTEAFDHLKRAHEIHEALVRRDRGDVGWRLDFAYAKLNLSTCLTKLGRIDEAVEFARHAATISRELLSESPESPQRKMEVAYFLREQGEALGLQGEASEALALLHEAIDLYRDLASRDTSDLAAQARLANCHSILADVLEGRGDLVGATTAREEALRLAIHVSETAPTDRTWKLNVAVDHRVLGRLLSERGHSVAAEKHHRDALQIVESLLQERPDDANLASQLDLAYNDLGHVLKELGKLEEASATADEEVSLGRKLVLSEPGSPWRLRNLAVSLGRQGILLQERGLLGEAKAVITEHVSILQDLVDHSPQVILWTTDLANGHQLLGALLELLGDPSTAEKEYETALQLMRQLAAKESSSSDATIPFALSTAFNQIALSAERREDWDKAIAAHLEQCSVCREFVEADPRNATWLYELAKGCMNLSRALDKSDRLPEAIEAGLEAVSHYTSLNSMDPEHIPWLNGLALAHNLLALLYDKTDTAKGLAHHARFLDLTIERHQRQPDSIHVMRELSLAYDNVSIDLTGLQRFAEALEASKQALLAYQKIQEREPFDASATETLLWRQNSLADALVAVGKTQEALELRRTIDADAEQLLSANPDIPGIKEAREQFASRLIQAEEESRTL